MAAPKITYDKYANDPSWQSIRIHGSNEGIVLPDSFMKSRRNEALQRGREERGKLFTEWTRSQVGLTSQSQGKSTKRVSQEVLQDISRKCSLDQAIISKIISTIQRFCKVSHLKDLQLGFRVAYKKERDHDFQPSPEKLAEINETSRRLEKLILNTNREVEQNFASFVGAYIDNELTIDRKVMIKKLDSKGRPIAYHWLPGATIQPTWRILRPWMEEWGKQDSSMFNQSRAAERLSARMYKNGERDLNGNMINLTKATYVQVLQDNRIVAAWEPDEIFVDITRIYAEMDETMYGYSPLEQSLGTSLLWIQATEYQQQLFNVSWPEAIMVLHGDYDQEGLEAFKQSVLADHGNSQRLPVIAAGAQQDGATAEMLELRKTPTEMLFGDLLNYLMNLKCNYYGLRPESLGGSSANVDTTKQQGVNYSVPEANDPGVRGRMEHLAEILTEQIIEPWEPDYEMVWCGLDSVPEDARIQRELGMMQMKTINESRASVGLPKLPKGIPDDDVGNWIPNPQYIAIVGQILADKAQQQQGPPQNPSQLSQPSDGSGGGDFGQGDSLPSGSDDSAGATQPMQGATPTQPTSAAQPTSPVPPVQPIQGAS